METQVLENDPVTHATAVARWDTPEAVAERAAARRTAGAFKPRPLHETAPTLAADADAKRDAF
jgi:hypothetical protein